MSTLHIRIGNPIMYVYTFSCDYLKCYSKRKSQLMSFYYSRLQLSWSVRGVILYIVGRDWICIFIDISSVFLKTMILSIQSNLYEHNWYSYLYAFQLIRGIVIKKSVCSWNSNSHSIPFPSSLSTSYTWVSVFLDHIRLSSFSDGVFETFS